MSIETETLPLIKGPRETRKSPRLTVPINVRVDGKIYPVSNWSVEGLSVTNFDLDIPAGKTIDIALLLAADDATIRVDLVAKTIWVNPSRKQCGLQFVNPEAKKVTLMNDVIDLNLKQYGKRTAAHSFGVVKGDHERPAFSSGRERIKRVFGLLLFAAIGISSVLFLGKMLYDRLFLFEAASASIYAETVSLAAPGEGIVKNIIPAGTIKDGEMLAQIQLATGGVSQVLSPCACETVSILKRNGSFVRAGEAVINLVKVDAQPLVSVRIAFHDLERVVEGATVHLLYLDGTAITHAKIKELPKIVDERSSLVTLYVEPGLPLLPSQVGQPVYAVIDTGPW